jgi:hypothetical protein
MARPLLALLALMAALPSAARAQSAPTEVRVIVPFTPGGLAAGLAVAARAPGSCWTASLASASRPDAWRCMAGNAIHDPCFVGFAGADQVAACLQSPWSSRVVLLTLSAPPPREAPRPANLLAGAPWALELASGERCTMFTGATWGVAGMRVNYGCPGDVSVVGELDRSAPTWRAFVLRGGAAVMGQVEIRTAYY